MHNISKLSVVAAAFLLLGAGCLSGSSSASVPDGGIFRSSDAGETWRATNAVPGPRGVGSLGGVNMLGLQADSHHAETLYASTQGQGIFITNDAGGQWRALGSVGERTVRMVAVDPVLPCVMYIATGNRIMKSEDCGRAFKIVYETPKADQEVRIVTVAPDNRALVYAGLSDGVFLISQNGGNSWAVAHRFDALIRKIVIDPKHPARMYLINERTGLWRSDDRGAKWESLGNALNNFAGARRGWDIAFDPRVDNRLVYASTYGLLASNDGGLSWNAIPLLSAPGEARIYSVALNPENSDEMYYSAVIGGKALLYKTEDGGANWKTKKLPTARIPVSILVRGDKPQELSLAMYQLQK